MSERGWPTPPPVPAPVRGASAISVAPFQRRAAVLGRAVAAQAKSYEIQGFLSVTGTGFALQEVHFPIRYLEMPSFVAGWSLEEGQQLVPDNYPRVNTGVARWIYEQHPMNVKYFAGAFLSIAAEGSSDQRLIIHWRATGKTVGTLGTSADQSTDGVV